VKINDNQGIVIFSEIKVNENGRNSIKTRENQTKSGNISENQ
jgi:hypothetical protein